MFRLCPYPHHPSPPPAKLSEKGKQSYSRIPQLLFLPPQFISVHCPPQQFILSSSKISYHTPLSPPYKKKNDKNYKNNRKPEILTPLSTSNIAFSITRSTTFSTIKPPSAANSKNARSLCSSHGRCGLKKTKAREGGARRSVVCTVWSSLACSVWLKIRSARMRVSKLCCCCC